MTLIEIVAGLVILGTILASLAVARGRFARQWAEADHKLKATRALDALIAEWMAVPLVPVNREGPLPGAKDFTWRTRAATNAQTALLRAAVVRVDVFDRRDRIAGTPPVVTVDLLVHAVPRTNTGETR